MMGAGMAGGKEGPMASERESLKPVEGADRPLRRRLDLKGALALALLPTLTVLGALGLVEALGRQRLLFASLASSAFLIYVDPLHGMNTVRTLLLAHGLALMTGVAAHGLIGPGYSAAGAAMVVTILAMILLDAVHPPAISTALTFAFRSPPQRALPLFALALGMIIALVVLQRAAQWILGRITGGPDAPSA
jgi:CBS-domain-containing membrane protein